MEDLKEISHKYESFGLQLGVSLATSRRIKEEVSGMDGVVDYALNRVIDSWLLEGKEVNRDFLVQAIESVGGFAIVATEVRKQGELLNYVSIHNMTHYEKTDSFFLSDFALNKPIG